jgi:site-specific recombinase XerD
MEIMTALEISISRVLDALGAAGYCPSTISFFKIAYKRLLKRAAFLHIDKFCESLAESFLSDTTSSRTGAYCRSREEFQGSCIKRLRECEEKGYVGWMPQTARGYEKPTSPEFHSLHADYLKHLRAEQKSTNTIDSYRNIARLFLSFLEQTGRTDLRKVNADSIRDFIIDIGRTWDSGSIRTAASGLRSFLEFAEIGSDLQRAVPVKLPRKISIIPILEPEEELAVWSLLKIDVVTARDCAILVLLLLTGLRAVDIVSLKLSEVDWTNETIRINQKKTSAPLVLPLVPAIGNALARYILQERPKSESPFVFLTSLAPFTPLQGHASCYAIVRAVFRQAGIRLGTELKGTRLLRHHVASKMLKSGVAIQTISSTLGHVNPDSADIYLTTDDKTLRECALPLAGIPFKVRGMAS